MNPNAFAPGRGSPSKEGDQVREALRVYGVKVSYFTGKLESYLRYKGIAYTLVPRSPGGVARAAGKGGPAAQIPALQLPDGRWLTDTTPTLAWLEEQYPDPQVIPGDPLQSFLSRLVEDYADEWLWRPAMHYRWSYPADRHLLARLIVDELSEERLFPRAIERRVVAFRQFYYFVCRDGVSRFTRAHVESAYLWALDWLSSVLSKRSFLLGERPTLADFAFMGPMFRHFSHDPTPASIMRERAPAVWAWVARCWNVTARRASDALVVGVPEDWKPLLREIGATHLEQLDANARAWQSGRRRFEMEIQGVRYRDLPVSQYRVWCLERLRFHFESLPETHRAETRALLLEQGCWEPLWRAPELASGHDPEALAPFSSGRPVFTHLPGALR